MNCLAQGFSEWGAAEWIAIITAISGAVVAIVKSFRADAKSDLANDRVSNVSKAQDTMRSDLTHLAANQTPPTTVVVTPPPDKPQS